MMKNAKSSSERIGGRVVKKIERKTKNGKIAEIEKKETVGGVLHWGRESSPDMDYFTRRNPQGLWRARPACARPVRRRGRNSARSNAARLRGHCHRCQPRRLVHSQMHAGVPAEASRAEAPLPEFILEDDDFLRDFYKAHPGMIGAGRPTKKQLETLLFNLDQGEFSSHPGRSRLARSVPGVGGSWSGQANGFSPTFIRSSTASLLLPTFGLHSRMCQLPGRQCCCLKTR